MKKLTALLFLFSSFCAYAQNPNTIFLTKDSLYNDLDSNWLFSPEDKPEMAQREYNDGGWKWLPSEIWINRKIKDSLQFKNVGWFRLRLHADSTVINIPMALGIDHSGASEIYLDGKLLKKTGIINGPDSSEYENPYFRPFVFIIPDTGIHVLAVRYANYDGVKNYRRYNHQRIGFYMVISEAGEFIEENEDKSVAQAIFMFLFSLFAAVSLIHLLLYLYQRRSWSNLYFSLFTLSISLISLCVFVTVIPGSPSLQILARFSTTILLAFMLFALSGVMNSVFPEKRKWRFYVISLMCLITALMWVFQIKHTALAFVIVSPIVTLEAAVKIIVAMVKKVKGSRIIGLGFFTFVFFVLSLLIITLINDGFQLNDSSVLGVVLLLVFVFSILSMPFSMSLYLAKNFATVNKDLKNQLEQVKILSEKNLEQEQEKKRLLENRQDELEREVSARTSEVMKQKEQIEIQHDELKAEKKKSDDLLLNILPAEVADELKQTGRSEARLYENVTVLFMDFVDFTKIAEEMNPSELVAEIDYCFKAFDGIIGTFGLEKIKTVGDAYIAVCGLPHKDNNHAVKTVSAALAILDFMNNYSIQGRAGGTKFFELRIGINSGPVVAGIVGVKKFAYDIWGDTVNTAARMEQNSEPGRINISETTSLLVRDYFELESRGKIEAKNKGMIEMFFVAGSKTPTVQASN